MTKTVVLYNRHALKRRPRHRIDDVADALRAAGIDHTLISPTKSGETVELIELAILKGAERIISTGGDGTVNEVVNGIVRAQRRGAARPKLAILPNGRGNDFGAAIGISQDLKRSIAVIGAGAVKAVDVGKVYDGLSERYFINGTGIGIDAAINYWATLSKLNGFPSYAWGLLKAIFLNYDQPRMKIRIDGLELDKQVLLLVAMNGRQEGGGFTLAPDFDLQDGLLNISLIGDGLPVGKVLPIVPAILKGQVENCPIIHRYKARKLEAEVLGRALIGQADGEVLNSQIRTFRAEVVPDTIDLIVPREA